MKRIPIIIMIVFGLLALPQWSFGTDDTDILIGSGTKPNVLIIFDNSTSMGEKVPYDDSVDYAQYYDAKKWPCKIYPAFIGTTIYKQKGQWVDKVWEWSCEDKCQSAPGTSCTEATGCVKTLGSCKQYKYEVYGQQDDFIDNDNPKDGQDDRNYNSTTRLFRGNYLNYLYFYTETKEQAAKKAIMNLVTNYQDQINFGLMTFRNDNTRCDSYVTKTINGVTTYYPRSDGGLLLIPVGDYRVYKGTKWACSASDNHTAVDAFGAWFTHEFTGAGGGRQGIPSTCGFPNPASPLWHYSMFTPLAESLTHAGMYFTGGWKGSGYYWPTYSATDAGCPDYNNKTVSYIRTTCISYPFDLPKYCRQNDGVNNFNNGGNSPITAGASCLKNHIILITDGKPSHDGNRLILGKYLGDSVIAGINDNMDVEDKTDGFTQHFLDDVADVLHNRTGNQQIVTDVIGFGLNNSLLASAATKGGGLFVSAGNTQALLDAFMEIAGNMLTSNVAVSTAAIPVNGMVSGDYMYVPIAYPAAAGIWNGDLQKFAINRDNMTAGTNIISSQTPVWSVEAKLQDLAKTGDSRKIYTYVTNNQDITDQKNCFDLTNSEQNGGNINKNRLGISGNSPDPAVVIQFVRGFNYNPVTKTQAPRVKILGDIIHSTPTVVDYGTSKVIYFGANDGMLHAIDDSDGSEKWGFIPPELLPNLQNLYNGNRRYFVDSSPKVAELNSGNLIASAGDTISQRILVFGLRKGGSYYYALDVTNPALPKFLWQIPASKNDSNFSELGETWSEPVFGNIKVGEVKTPVAIFGGGYSIDNSKGRGVYVVNVRTGEKILSASKTYADSGAMSYSIPSTVLTLDPKDDGIIERVYVGDLGGQMWAFNLAPKSGNDWTFRRLFSPGLSGLQIFYPPDLVKENGYHYLYFGTGNRNNPKLDMTVNRFYCVKDKDLPNDQNKMLQEGDLLLLTTSDDSADVLSGLKDKNGWYIVLSPNPGEKVLAPATVFGRVAYFTTFAPPSDACQAGGDARVYAVHYTDGQSVFKWKKVTDATTGKTTAMAGKTVTLSNFAGIPSEVMITIIAPKMDTNGKLQSGEQAGGTLIPLVASGGGITNPGSANMVNPLMPYSWRPTNP